MMPVYAKWRKLRTYNLIPGACSVPTRASAFNSALTGIIHKQSNLQVDNITLKEEKCARKGHWVRKLASNARVLSSGSVNSVSSTAAADVSQVGADNECQSSSPIQTKLLPHNLYLRLPRKHCSARPRRAATAVRGLQPTTKKPVTSEEISVVATETATTGEEPSWRAWATEGEPSTARMSGMIQKVHQ
ncbi:hypothetical protein GQ600_19700 [Phytophthora cactorum]|nr:hypothetical protein GQ600_19700 [Phytophthora cactorum]